MRTKDSEIPQKYSRLLDRLITGEDVLHLKGDFEEIYAEILEDRGKRFAIRWIIRQILVSAMQTINESFRWSFVMINNYLKIALRNLFKHKGYSAITILSLGTGLACVVLITLFVRDELSYDRFHENKDRIYRLVWSITDPETNEQSFHAVGPYRLAEEMQGEFADLEAIVRIAPREQVLVRSGEREFYEDNLAVVDPSIFRAFTFPLKKGDPATALVSPFSIVVTEAIASKYVGDTDPIGKSLSLMGNDFEITGVLEDIPERSQFGYEIMASLNCAPQVFSRIVLENWGEGSCETYILMPEGMRTEDLEPRFEALVDARLPEREIVSPRLMMQPLSHLYLQSSHIQTYSAGGSLTNVYAFTAIAVFILIIACINFMNLATARSANRAKEVGLRKVVGALRTRLIAQFLAESVLLSAFSFIVALILCISALPLFNSISGKTFSIVTFLDLPLFLTLATITLIVGLVAGSYPAFFLSAFQPVKVLSGACRRGTKGGWFRRILVTFQFAVSIFLIVATAVVARQMAYAKQIRLGYDKEHLIMIRGTPLSLRTKYMEFSQSLKAHPNIVGAAGASRIPPERLRSSIDVRPEGTDWERQRGMQTIWADFGYIETMGYELAAGRSFSREYVTDAAGAFIINETACREIGWTSEEAVGKSFGSSIIRDWDKGQWEHINGHIIGVLKDFHFESLHKKIVPTVYFIWPYMAWKYVIRIRPGNIPETINHIEKTWDRYVPDRPFIYAFVDDEFDRLYRSEQRQGRLFGAFAVLAVFVACLGLVGLASFTAEQRTKEVGIRKVLGATAPRIVFMMSREFTLLVVAAFAVGAPLAWFVMKDWLQDFSYHFRLGIGLFLIAGAFALVLAWLTVSFQAARVAMSNPAESLRYE